MGLAASQRAFALLATDAAARAAYDDDPLAFARACGLAGDEAAELAAFGAARVRAYAGTLARKRADEAARALPLAAAALGGAFRRAFLAYAERVPLGAGPARGRDDALRFARSLPGEPALAFAAAALAVAALPRPLRFRLGVYRFDPRHGAVRGRAAPTLACWTPLRDDPWLVRLGARPQR